MARYAWIIDKDFDPDPKVEPPSNHNAVGMCGPRDAPEYLIEALRKYPAAGRKFRMAYDDPPDPEFWPEYPVIYEGRCILEGVPSGWDLTEEYFGPLLDFGTPNVGAANIFYWQSEVEDWIQL